MMRWFKHITQSRMDEKMSSYFIETGLQGYGFWWILIETVSYHVTKESSTAEVTYLIKQWAKICGISLKTFVKLCDKCTEHSLISTWSNGIKNDNKNTKHP